jgi:hypothetical protein
MSQPIWVDTNILVNIDNGRMPTALAEISKLEKDGYEVLLPPSVEREFLHGPGMRAADTARRQRLLASLDLEVDTMVNQVPMTQLQAWRQEAIDHGLSVPDADIIAQVRASAWTRGVKNPVFLTRETGGTLVAMRQRGVTAIEFKTAAITEEIPAPRTVPSPTDLPDPPVVPGPLSGAKTAFMEGLESAFRAENIAAEIPNAILMIADKVAAREAVHRIKIKFLKEGFAKGVAAGVMGWTEVEVASNLMNHVTPFRIEGMEDPAGYLSLVYMLQLAEANENYAVGVGFYFSSNKSLRWKTEIRGKGFEVLHRRGYYYGDDPETLFTYDFINDLAYVLRPTTDPIVERAL